MHDELRGRQLNGNRHGPVVPIVPAKREAEAFIHVQRAVGGKGSGNRHVGGKLAQAGHQEVDHRPDEDVGGKRASRAGLGD